MMKFKANLGPADRLIRLVLGIVLLNLAATATGLLFYVGLIVGLVGLATGLTSSRPIYSIFRIPTLESVES